MTNADPITNEEYDLMVNGAPGAWLEYRHKLRMRRAAARLLAKIIAMSKHPSTEPEEFDAMMAHESRLVETYGRPRADWLDKRVAMEGRRYAAYIKRHEAAEAGTTL